MAGRTVLVTPERLPGWIGRFTERHGEVTTIGRGALVVLVAADGAEASYPDAAPAADFGLVLVRRGGYAVGLVRGGTLVGSRCGTRYVQGRTKAGGWSQQRYARRRANQAAGLARACADAVDAVLHISDRLACGSVYGGGDRPLVHEALSAARTPVTLSERWLDVREPRHAVLVAAVEDARSVVIALNDLA